MHDVSLGQTIRDYLTGEEVEETTYEEFRQALARLLVEEKGCPRERVRPRVPVTFPVDGKEYTRLVDLAVYDDAGKPLFVLFFCSGEPSTYNRESVAAARLFPDGPAPLAAATDTKDAVLLAAADGKELARGFASLPDYAAMRSLAAEHPAAPLPEDALERERRILYAYSEFLYGCCGAASCAADERGGRFGPDKD